MTKAKLISKNVIWNYQCSNCRLGFQVEDNNPPKVWICPECKIVVTLDSYSEQSVGVRGSLSDKCNKAIAALQNLGWGLTEADNMVKLAASRHKWGRDTPVSTIVSFAIKEGYIET